MNEMRKVPYVSCAKEISWQDVLQSARSRPHLYIGDLDYAHLYALKGALAYITVAQPFAPPFYAHLVLSPTEYWIRCVTGPLLKQIQDTIEWESDKMLVDLLDEPIFNRTGGTSLRNGTYPVFLAERFFVGIASGADFRYQSYSRGWPDTEVLSLHEETPYTFVVAGQLKSEWFVGLPFNLSDVEAVIEEYPSIRVLCEMRQRDDIFPAKAENMTELCF